MTVELYEHLNLDVEGNRLEELVASGATLAHHADADGFFAAYFARRIGGRSGGVINVTTDDLSLAVIAEEMPNTRSRDIVLFDINILSFPSAIGVLSTAVDRATVYDDHVGEARELPANIAAVELLPPADAHYPGIRPASLFCHSLLMRRGANTRLDDLLAHAAAIGEGVAHAFAGQLPHVSKGERALAKRIGWGVNAYFTGRDIARLNERALLELETIEHDGDNSAEVLRSSRFLADLDRARGIVTEQVDSWADRTNMAAPWFEAGGQPVFRVDIVADHRIVNLVSSEVRTRADRGVSVATQETSAGLAVELRRARSLDQPDLTKVLLEIPAEYVVSRGGHPMACGATFTQPSAARAMELLKEKLIAALDPR